MITASSHEGMYMGKGDVRTRRGKIVRGTFGSRRRRKRKKTTDDKKD
ncbi:MAG: 30S ribosomal protein THX [Pseudomonadales bacterium]|nr:30S ribosomal protein THX [Pseudomonadales bacterium]